MVYELYMVPRSRPIAYRPCPDGSLIIGNRRLAEVSLVYTHGRTKFPDVELHSMCPDGTRCFEKFISRTGLAEVLRQLRSHGQRAHQVPLEDGDVLQIKRFGGRKLRRAAAA